MSLIGVSFIFQETTAHTSLAAVVAAKPLNVCVKSITHIDPSRAWLAILFNFRLFRCFPNPAGEILLRFQELIYSITFQFINIS